MFFHLAVPHGTRTHVWVTCRSPVHFPLCTGIYVPDATLCHLTHLLLKSKGSVPNKSSILKCVQQRLTLCYLSYSFHSTLPYLQKNARSWDVIPRSSAHKRVLKPGEVLHFLSRVSLLARVFDTKCYLDTKERNLTVFQYLSNKPMVGYMSTGIMFKAPQCNCYDIIQELKKKYIYMLRTTSTEASSALNFEESKGGKCLQECTS